MVEPAKAADADAEYGLIGDVENGFIGDAENGFIGDVENSFGDAGNGLGGNGLEMRDVDAFLGAHSCMHDQLNRFSHAW